MRIVRHILLALLASLLLGLLVGTIIRLRMERETRYFVDSPAGPRGGLQEGLQEGLPQGRLNPAPSGPPGSVAGPPAHVGDVRPPVLDPGHHEEQVG